ncbi:DNA polymerase-3 subunit epsilon [Caldalkalibacillus uzonensis]|uniref:DNA polymerase-3 subunit epsilon n=1 Tax=Caldalkalibacillus uzonensis TaxID=353224 RepID=A0ABU0CQ01_9BACI|nr:3'-5' exonuclease [Caldalkalibacillus uzonensis]MDQ0337981.1 DNA polymerase-3 subunit epsilon [Caldalkalibacillus uzonensis]
MFWKRKKLPFNFIQPIPLSTPIDQLSFVVLDTETTGLDVHRHDRLIELGAVLVKHNQVTDRVFHRFVNPEREIPPTVQQLTGIKPEVVQGALRSIEAIEQFFRFLEQYGGAGWVGFHLRFDLTVLRHELKRHHCTFETPQAIDLLHLIRLLHPTAVKQSLEDYARDWQVPLFARHTAVGDALTSAHLFTRLMQQLPQRGIQTWGDLIRAVERGQEQFAL